MSGNVKAKWGDLTDAEIDGNRQALEGKILVRYGKTKEQAHKGRRLPQRVLNSSEAL